MLTVFGTRLVGWSRQRPWLVIALTLAMTALGAWHAARTLTVNTDTTALFDAGLPFRIAEKAFDQAFPGEVELVVSVIDGPNAIAAQRAADRLAERLATREDLFFFATNPTGGPFYEKNGVLYLSIAEIDKLATELAIAQPLLGAIATDRSPRGLFRLAELAFTAAATGEPSAAAAGPAVEQFATAVDSALAGKDAGIDWAELFTELNASRSNRAFVLARAKLDMHALEQGKPATTFVRQSIEELGLTAANGYRVRLTGEVPLTDEEFATVAEGTTFAGTVAVILVGILMVMALGSLFLVSVTLATLFVGFILTLGWAAISVGEINLISIAFTFMFVGIAVDFGMQFCLRYRAERRDRGSSDDAAALDATGAAMAQPLLLAAATVSLGFFAFLPTEYRGVSELGVIAGGGIIIAFVLNFTFLPALLRLKRMKPETAPVGYVWATPINTIILRRRRTVILAAAIVSLLAAIALPRLVFDFDPMKLKDSDTESMATALELMADPLVNPNTISTVARTPEDVEELSRKLEALPDVDHVQTVFDLVPEAQETKLAVLGDLALILDPVINPLALRPAPTTEEVLAAARVAREAAETYLQSPAATGPLRDAASHARESFGRLIEQGNDALVQKLSASLLAGFDDALGPLRGLVQAAPVTLETLPARLRENYIAADGRYRIQVFPKDNSRDIDAMARFTNAVRTVAPDAIGAPVVIYESGRIVTRAFLIAGALAVVAIAILLLIIMRRIDDILRVLAPLLLALVLTLGTCALIGFSLNFANIIALPLLLAVGVAYPIYFVSAWREGEQVLLASPSGRGMLYSALTDTAAFGSMALATHTGTSSMGVLLTMALGFNLIATLIVLPAILGLPPAKAR